MKRRFLLLAIPLVAACGADNRSSIEITGRAAPSSATTCTFAPGGQNILGPGLLDVSFGRMTYSAVLYVTNSLADPTDLGPDAVRGSKDWRAESARVRLNPKEYTDAFGPTPALLPATGENDLPLDGQVTPANGGKSTQGVDLVSPTLAQELAKHLTGAEQRVVLGVTLKGHTLDGAELDSGEWYFPIDVCSGCLAPSVPCNAPSFLVASNCFGIAQDSTPVCKCANGLTACSDGCVDTDTDTANCGTCSNACESAQTCSNGTCCATGFTGCSGSCVDIHTDTANCGTCGNACATGNACCSGACADLQTDTKNCGTCGTACPTGQKCTAGVCG